MSCKPAIKLEGVSKSYQSYRRPLDRLIQTFSKRRLYEEFWALQDIDLEVWKGETVGIVGENGSGKSTLLQLIVGTLTPTSGRLHSEGRISAILELGAGFNPEFTGKENARLNAAIVGMTSEEIDQRMPDIMAFSELGDFIDRKVKTYSSGMYIRLAFSVVINMEPDILVIDEALAVGDSRFQRKCFRKLDELRNGGTTILFVTHATDAVVAHCDRGVFLKNGQVVTIGDPKQVINNYMESMFHSAGDRVTKPVSEQAGSTQLDDHDLNDNPLLDMCPLRPSYNDTEYEWGNGKATIFDYVVLTESGIPVSAVVDSGERLSISCGVHFQEGFENIIYGLTIKTVDGKSVFGTNTDRQHIMTDSTTSGDVIHVRFDVELNLISSEYFFSIGVVARDKHNEEDTILHRRYDLFRLKVQDDNRAFGYASLPIRISTEKKLPEVA